MPTPPARSLWTWHRWLGLALLLPLLWWTLTALVFALRPIEEIRGRTWSTGIEPAPAALTPAPFPAPEALVGVRSLSVRLVEGHQLLILDRGPGLEPELTDQRTGAALGGAIPLAWALDAARRDFAGPFVPEAVYLLPRHGAPRRVAGAGPEVADDADGYLGPRPAYAIHLAGWPAMHLYVDAVEGGLKARRTWLWRLYDAAFRLHALDFLPDLAKRAVIGLVVLGWLALGVTGARLALAWLRRRRPAGAPAAAPRT